MSIEPPYTAAQISELTGLHVQTVFALISKGHIKRLRLPGLSRKVLVARADLHAYLKAAGYPVPEQTAVNA